MVSLILLTPCKVGTLIVPAHNFLHLSSERAAFVQGNRTILQQIRFLTTSGDPKAYNLSGTPELDAVRTKGLQEEDPL